MDISGVISNFLINYEAAAIFLGSFFFGETVVISSAFLSARGFWSMQSVFWLSFAGTMCSDILWFIFGRPILTYFHKWEQYREKSAKLVSFLDGFAGSRPFFSLLFIKFLYGTRILTIMYLSIRQIGLWRFILFNAVGTVIWLAVVLPIGWLAGNGIVNIIPFLNKFEYAALFLLVVLVLIRLLTKWLGNQVTKK